MSSDGKNTAEAVVFARLHYIIGPFDQDSIYYVAFAT